jgi:hypothetical protein
MKAPAKRNESGLWQGTRQIGANAERASGTERPAPHRTEGATRQAGPARPHRLANLPHVQVVGGVRCGDEGAALRGVLAGRAGLQDGGGFAVLLALGSGLPAIPSTSQGGRRDGREPLGGGLSPHAGRARSARFWCVGMARLWCALRGPGPQCPSLVEALGSEGRVRDGGDVPRVPFGTLNDPRVPFGTWPTSPRCGGTPRARDRRFPATTTLPGPCGPGARLTSLRRRPFLAVPSSGPRSRRAGGLPVRTGGPALRSSSGRSVAVPGPPVRSGPWSRRFP